MFIIYNIHPYTQTTSSSNYSSIFNYQQSFSYNTTHTQTLLETMKNFISQQYRKLRQIKTKTFKVFGKAEQLQFKLVTPTGTKVAQIGSQVQYPRNRYINLQGYLQMFYNSTSQNGRSNGQNVAFVVGAENSGKSQLIKQSIKLFKNRKIASAYNKNRDKKGNENAIPFTTLSSPEYLQDLQRKIKLDNPYSLIVQFDFGPNHTMMKPEAFFHHISTKITTQIINTAKQLQNLTNQQILTPKILMDIVLADNSKSYIYVFIKDVIYTMLNNCCEIKIKNKENLGILESINDVLSEIGHQEFYGGKRLWGMERKEDWDWSSNKNQNKATDNVNGKNRDLTKNNNINSAKQLKSVQEMTAYEKIIKIIAVDQNISQLQASITFFLCVFKRLEHQTRPATHTHTLYETGIHTTQFLFSIMNYLCGFGNLNKLTLQAHIDSSSVSTDSKNNSFPVPPTFISKGNHIDTILTFHHLQNLSCYSHPKFKAWFDHMLIRSHNASNLRTHFPIIIELASCQELSQLQKLGRMEVDNPTVIQIPGYFQTNMFRYSPHLIFNSAAIYKLRPVLGRNPSTWNQVVVELAKGTPMLDVLERKAPIMTINRLKFQSRINRLFLNPQNLPQIDNNTLYVHILQFLKIAQHCKGNMKNWYLQINQQIFNNKIFHQLYSSKIFYQYYYQSAISLSDMRDLTHIQAHLKNLTFAQHKRYKIWKWFLSPHLYYLKELRYRDDYERELYKDRGPLNRRSDYLLTEYYGELLDYRIQLYNQVLKIQYNL